ncbi:MAG: transposase [Deltaproteobacteria bacterium]|nr:transposase [Deltaproteobacteria bacterium]
MIQKNRLCRPILSKVQKENTLVTNSRGQLVSVKDLFRGLKTNEAQILDGERLVYGLELFIIGMILPTGEYLIIVTDKEPETAMEDYAQRWEIETLFGCLKSRGFNFESTHITDPERISKMVALLAIAFCWCHLTGEWMVEQKPIPIKKHGRKAKAIFRYGLGSLRDALVNRYYRKGRLINIIKILVESLLNKQLIQPIIYYPELLSRT